VNLVPFEIEDSHTTYYAYATSDDYGFWPTTPDSLGINAWIALDDIPVSFGGGFALAAGSHLVSWRMEAHEAIGSPLTFPKDGFKDGT